MQFFLFCRNCRFGIIILQWCLQSQYRIYTVHWGICQTAGGPLRHMHWFGRGDWRRWIRPGWIENDEMGTRSHIHHRLCIASDQLLPHLHQSPECGALRRHHRYLVYVTAQSINRPYLLLPPRLRRCLLQHSNLLHAGGSICQELSCCFLHF